MLWSAAWDGGSVWDLPIDSVAQAPTIEQMQQYEKAKTAKVRPPLASRKEKNKRGLGCAITADPRLERRVTAVPRDPVQAVIFTPKSASW